MVNLRGPDGSQSPGFALTEIGLDRQAFGRARSPVRAGRVARLPVAKCLAVQHFGRRLRCRNGGKRQSGSNGDGTHQFTTIHGAVPSCSVKKGILDNVTGCRSRTHSALGNFTLRMDSIAAPAPSPPIAAILRPIGARLRHLRDRSRNCRISAAVACCKSTAARHNVRRKFAWVGQRSGLAPTAVAAVQAPLRCAFAQGLARQTNQAAGRNLRPDPVMCLRQTSRVVS